MGATPVSETSQGTHDSITTSSTSETTTTTQGHIIQYVYLQSTLPWQLPCNCYHVWTH